MARIVDQDVEEAPADGGGPAIRQGVAADRVVSVVDAEMRHGRKSPSRRVDGYKSHLLTDHDSEMVLGVAVTPANDADGPEAAPLVAGARAAGVAVAEVLGDTAYGDGDTRQAVEEVGAKVTAKTQPPATTGASSRPTSSSTPTPRRPPARLGTQPLTRAGAPTTRAAVS